MTQRLKFSLVPSSGGGAAQIYGSWPETLERKAMAQFEIYKDERLEFRWRFKANNGEILAESTRGYNNRANCEHSIILVKQQVANARINSDFKPDQNTE